VLHHLRTSGHHYDLQPQEIEDLMTIAMHEIVFDIHVPFKKIR
jgi:hypothetical protein